MSKAKIIYEDIAVGAAEDSTVAYTGAMPISTPTMLLEGITPKVTATLEHNSWGLDGSYNLFDASKVAFWSFQLSREDCTFSQNQKPTITFTFGGIYTIIGLTITFAEEIQNFVSQFTVYWYRDSTLVTSQTFNVEETVVSVSKTAKNFNKMVIEINKTQLPYTRARINKLLLGIERTFEMSELRNVSIQQECDPISNTVATSTMTWTLDSLDDIDYIFQSKQPLKAYDGDNLIGVYYITGSKQRDARLYDINSEDALGVLDSGSFAGKVYTGNTLVKDDLAEIIGEDFVLSLDSSYASTYTPSGYITACSNKEALRQICFAIGACVTTMDTDTIIVKPSDVSSPDLVTYDEIFTGSDIETGDKITAVVVTAHSLTQDDTNGSIEIGGHKYTDTLSTITVNNPNTVASDKPNIQEVTEMTLINPNNLTTVADRVYNYIVRRSRMSAKIILGNHQVGDYVQMPTKWGDNLNGNITSMSISLSNLTVADCEILGI